ncbi:MAG: SDR family NAD(P)-dependent oxidoreductase [Planctomycetota bacterium]
MTNWNGKTLVIAGGSSGLGFAIARALSKHQCSVVLLARNASRLEAAALELEPEAASRVLPLSVDLLDEQKLDETVQRIVSEFGKIDGWFNCVGQSIRVSFKEAALQDYRRLMEQNFFTSVIGSLAALPHLEKTNGTLVNIGSLASKTAWPWIAPYVTSKHALAGFAKQLRIEGPPNVHYLFVCPGPIRSDKKDRYAEQAKNLPKQASGPAAGAPVNRLEPDALASRILDACAKKKIELVLPAKTKILFLLQQISAKIGDWLVRRSCQ